MSDSSLVTFKAITSFANALGELFGSKQRPLKLYCRLINQTTLSNEGPISKHIEAFRKFCVANREAITAKDPSKMKMNNVSYSQRVFIDFKNIFAHADKENMGIIWKHLLVVSALVDPAGKAKSILQQSPSGENKETDFLSDVIDKVEKTVTPDANPMQAISSIMQSGIFTDLVNGMNNGLQDGSLDLGKLMGAVQGMVTSVGTLGRETEGDTDDDNVSDKQTQQMPDLAGMMGPMLTALAGGGSSGEENPISGLLGGLMQHPKKVDEQVSEQSDDS